MTEQNTTGRSGDQLSAALDSENERSSSATKLTIGLAGLAVILVVGVVLSIVMIFRGDDEPLVSLDPTTDGGAGAQAEDSLFEPDPVFDKANRVIYVPLDPRGVVLSETLASGNRPADQAPSGVMLQRIHGNMDLPFSTSDGPTGFTDNGVATGFSRTPQGAALAAAHYFAHITGGTDRLELLEQAGKLSDPTGQFASLGLPDNMPTAALQMVKVVFHRDLTLVKFGYTAKMDDGSTKVVASKIPMVWREDTGWVLTADSAALGVEYEPVPAEGWQQWW